MRTWWTALHFIQPKWLWLLTVVPLLYLSFRLRHDIRARWKRYIDPELLDHLIVPPNRRWRLRPIHTTCILISLGAIALAGPTWKREQPPFTEDKAPLVIALDLSRTMDAIDLDPTRIERAKLKLRDLLKLRDGGRTALFVYAGTTHMVLPFTTDSSLFDLYLDSLSTSLMPGTGKDSAKALHVIEDFLKDEVVPGTILFVTDGIEPRAVLAFSNFMSRNADKDDILVMGVGTSHGAPVRTSATRFLADSAGRRVYAKLDVDALRSLSRMGISATTLTLDDDDIHWIQRHIQHHLQTIQQRDSKTRWINEGYWLTIPIVVIAAFWFRKGWTVQWTSSAMAIALSIPGSAGTHFSWMNLWLTADQQGRYYYEKGEYQKAAQRFQDPLWKGLALVRAGQSDDALNAFALSDSAEGWYDQGNVLAHLNRYPEAVQAYKEALLQQPAWHEAKDNLELVESLIAKEKTKKDEETERSPNLPPDQVKFDDQGKKGKQLKVQMKFDPAKMADIWMRNIQTSPADFLRLRFAIQAAKEGHQ
jgi:Ca-activated chloride channel family protein